MEIGKIAEVILVVCVSSIYLSTIWEEKDSYKRTVLLLLYVIAMRVIFINISFK